MLSIQNWEQGKVSLPTTHIQHCTKILDTALGLRRSREDGKEGYTIEK